MIHAHSLPQKLKQLLVILVPLLVTQVALSAMNFVDTMMSGRVSANDLAGVAIGSSVWVPVYTGLTGILLALTPIVSQFVGARRTDRVPHAVVQGVYLAVALAAGVTVVGGLSLTPLLGAMELESEVRHIARHYLIGLGWGIVPLFIYTVLRCFIDALGQTRVTMAITLASLPINIFFNYVLIFGEWGFPRLGGIGAGYASAITYWIIALLASLVVVRLRPFTGYRVFGRFFPISLAAWKEQLRVGLPMGLAIFCEVSIFSAVTLLMSRFGTVTIAAHQAAINFESLLYMIPLSISMALTIAVGHEVGAGRMRDAVAYSYLGIGTSVVVGLVGAAFLLLFNREVAGLYTSDAEVLSLAQSFLIYAIFFQLSDAVAAPIQGALRGYKDVNVTLVLALVSYWAIGLPLGYALANYSPLGPFGYWVGLISGLAAGAVGLVWRLRQRQRADRETGAPERWSPAEWSELHADESAPSPARSE